LVDAEDHPFDLSPSATGFCAQRDLDEMIPDHIMDYHDITPYDTALLSLQKMEPSVAAHSEPSPTSSQEGPLVLAHVSSFVSPVLDTLLDPVSISGLEVFLVGTLRC
jgi:hypothetical protein